MKDAKIIFMGTASFSKQVLEKLLENNYNVVAVVTQPDRFVGRKKVLTMPEVKEVALASGIPVYQPLKIKEEYQEIIALEPDLIITAAYGQIVPEAVLNAPKIGCINVHASLLPKYRGGAPVHYAIMEGEEVTGVTIMYMVKKMDAGNIISQVEVPIGAEETTGELYERLSIAGAELLLETLPSVLAGTNESIAQDESLVTYSPTISHEQEKIDFSKSALRVYNQVRGMNPWPGAYTTYQGKVVKIWVGKIHVCENALKHHAHQENGTIVKIFKDAIGVKTGEIIFLKLIVNSNKQPNGCFFYKLKDIIREDTKEEIEMIISTLSSYPNKKVVKDLGIVVGYDDAIRAFRVTMGVEEYIVKAQENLAKAAEKLGANAVLGVCFDLRDSNKPVLMGTAVVLEDLE